LLSYLNMARMFGPALFSSKRFAEALTMFTDVMARQN
jgi:hypothetical protein